MTPALRWAAMRAVSMFHLIVRITVTRQRPQLTIFKQKGAKAESNRGHSAYQPSALPLGQNRLIWEEFVFIRLLNAARYKESGLLTLHAYFSFTVICQRFCTDITDCFATIRPRVFSGNRFLFSAITRKGPAHFLAVLKTVYSNSGVLLHKLIFKNKSLLLQRREKTRFYLATN